MPTGRDAPYDLKSVQAPRLTGNQLTVFANLVESPLTRWALTASLLENAGLPRFRRLRIDPAPLARPDFTPAPPWASQPLDLETLAAFATRERPTPKIAAGRTIRNYASAYRAGQTTPIEIARQTLAAIAASQTGSQPLNIFVACNEADVLTQAQAATERLRAGQPRSLLEGIPVAVKDELDQHPYPTTVGTRFLGQAPATADATVVARLRAAGAILIGKTNMHEIGIGVTGSNPHHGTVRNPRHPDRHTGGSSSGSAAAVAAGLCPLAIGADGGGSIRIPAALCGVLGLKPTYGRVSEWGAAPLCWSVAHIGPLAATAEDLALGYALLAGPDPHDPHSLRQPEPGLSDFDQLDLSGLTLGVYWPWFRHAAPGIVSVCAAMLTALQNLGAVVREVEIPDLDAARVAHLISISSEMAACMDRYQADHRHDFSGETRIDLALAREFSARDYIQAQRMRARATAHVNQALQQVEVLITPTTGVTAPLITPEALTHGESDLSLLTELMRFVTLFNLTGHPAISFPAGADPAGLPVGLQAVGRPWQEHTLLRLAHAAEQIAA